MEDIPPSYNSINPSVLELLPPYLETASLLNLCLVSRTYHQTFIPHVWGNPASHFVPLTGDSPNGALSTDPANIEVTGSHNDMVYVALTRFKRTLRKARLSTRMLCHTLHLPPALSEIYGGPNITWLKEVLERLPALQSLCVAGLPFFDHHSLLAVDRDRHSSAPSCTEQDGYHTYPVKMLLAMKEPNATSIGLSLFLPHLPSLVYLDLSYTTPARDINVLASLVALHDLQVLKLRGVGLRDTEAEALANAIGLRVRLLDIAENLFTDMGIRSILQACFLLSSTTAAQQNGLQSTPAYNNTNGHNYSRRHLESWPVGLPPSPDFLSLDTIRTVNLDNALMTQLTNPLTGRLAFEDIPHGGITHLYLSGNKGLSIEGIRSILDLGRLHVLDAGDIGGLSAVDLTVLRARQRTNSRSTPKSKNPATGIQSFRSLKTRARSPSSSSYNGDDGNSITDEHEEALMDNLKFPRAEKLIPVLQEKASKNLTHLRIEHSLITNELDLVKDRAERRKSSKLAQELSNDSTAPKPTTGTAELDSSSRNIVEADASHHYAVEMPSDPMVFELDSTPAQPRAELAGDIIHFAISPPMGEKPAEEPDEGRQPPIRGEGAYAPEAVMNGEDEHHDDDDDSDEEIILDASGSGTKRKKPAAAPSIDVVLSQVETPPPLRVTKKSSTLSKDKPATAALTQSGQRLRQSQINSLMSLRPKGPLTRFHPSALPYLQTLLLTNVPTEIPASLSKIVDNLKSFISACAVEAHLASLQAKTNYSLPPGRARHDAEREHARTLFALQTIILEMSSPLETGPQRDWKHTGQRLNLSKSSTGDMDSEALWSAAANDFSFFGEEGEEHDECGIYDQEPEKYFPTVTYDDKIAVMSSEEESSTMSSGHSYITHRDSPNSPTLSGGTMSSHPNSYGGTLSPMSPVTRQGTLFKSPRHLPLHKNRRSSNEHHRNISTASLLRDLPERPSSAGPSQSNSVEMPGTIPTSRPPPPTSNPVVQDPEPQPMMDVVSELSKWRKERKAAYEQEFMRQMQSNPNFAHPARMADSEIFVEGYWKGEVKVVRNAKAANKNKGRMARTGNVDVYGNYFEGGYLYP